MKTTSITCKELVALYKNALPSDSDHPLSVLDAIDDLGYQVIDQTSIYDSQANHTYLITNPNNMAVGY